MWVVVLCSLCRLEDDQAKELLALKESFERDKAAVLAEHEAKLSSYRTELARQQLAEERDLERQKNTILADLKAKLREEQEEEEARLEEAKHDALGKLRHQVHCSTCVDACVCLNALHTYFYIHVYVCVFVSVYMYMYVYSLLCTIHLSLIRRFLIFFEIHVCSSFLPNLLHVQGGFVLLSYNVYVHCIHCVVLKGHVHVHCCIEKYVVVDNVWEKRGISTQIKHDKTLPVHYVLLVC